MNKFYTSAELSGDNILVRGYEDGKAFFKKVKYKPTLFVPSDNSTEATWRSIRGEPLAPMKFDSIKEAKEFVSQYDGVGNFEIHGLMRHQYAYLNEQYPGEVPYDRELISVGNLDIEVASERGFPSPDDADQEVTAITLKIHGMYHVFGCHPFKTKRKDITYHLCTDESALLRSFLGIWTANYPNIVTGWNISFFDIPYLVNRIAIILGNDEAKKLSPWGFIQDRSVTLQGRTQTAMGMAGIATLDYYEMYRKFTYTQQESYRLGAIAHVELGDEKIDYTQYVTIHNMYKQNYQLFIEYNIKDVEIIDRLDDKMGLIDMCIALAYDAHVNMSDVFTQVRMWDVMSHNELYKSKIAVPNTQASAKGEAYEGAFVKDPLVGGHDWVISYDLASLYPHLIMQYNISPETIDSGTKAEVTVNDLLTWSSEDIPRREGYSLAANGCYFSNKKQGFLPRMMQRMYDDRVRYKELMLAAQKAKETERDPEKIKQLVKDISKYENIQKAKKIQLNSAYGAIGNPYFRFFDVDQATAITLGGQLSIRWAEINFNLYMNKVLKTTGVDYIIAADTDSLYIACAHLIEKLGMTGSPKAELVEFLDKCCKNKFDKVISDIYEQMFIRMGSYKNKMVMKRDIIADRAIWTAKKRYLMNVWDAEGVRYTKPKVKIMGLEAIKSSTPSACRKSIKAAFEIILNAGETETQAYIAKFREEFASLPFEDIAFPRGVQGLEKYAKNPLSQPIHVRASLAYNNKLKDLKIQDRYEMIQEGEKIKFCYLKTPNPVYQNVIAAITHLPKEFGLEEYIDYDKQFDKSFLEPILAVLNVLKWDYEVRNTIDRFFA